MEVILPLRTKSKQSGQPNLALECSGPALAPKHWVVVENGSDLVCFCDGSTTFLYHLCCSRLQLLGTFFFRHAGNTQVLSMLADGAVKDLPESPSAVKPMASSSGEVRLSSAGRCHFVGFAADMLVLGTEAGYLGAVLTSSDRSELYGKSLRLPCTTNVRWALSAGCGTCVGVSMEGIYVVALSAERSTVAAFDAADVGGHASAVAAYASLPASAHSVFIAHTGSGDITRARCEPGESKARLERYTLLLGDDSGDNHDEPTHTKMLALEWASCCALAVVHPDVISFTSWDETALRSSAAVRNELTSTFKQALWKRTSGGGRLFAIRSDAHCLLYDVAMCVGGGTIEEVVVSGQVVLPSVTVCRLGGATDGLFLCWQPQATTARHAALLQSSADGSSFSAVEVRQADTVSQTSPSTALLLEVVPISGSYGVVCLFSNGECHLSLYRSRGTVRIAVEDNPSDATSCLAFETRDKTYACVLGFADGDVRLFVDGTIRAWVRVVHCGVVDKLIWLPKMNEADDTLFVSISTEMGTVCFHAGNNAAVSRTMSSPARPLTSCLLNKDLEYLTLLSHTTGNLWHLPTCRLERAFRLPHGAVHHHADDLLEYHWASAMKVLKFPFAGSPHYAVSINVETLVCASMAGVPPQQHPSQEFVSALSLLLRCMGESCAAVAPATDAFSDALDDLGLGVAGAVTHDCAWHAIVMLCELLHRTSDAASAGAIFATVESLTSRVVQCGPPSSRRQADSLERFVARFFTLSRPTPAPLRFALESLIVRSDLARLRSLIRTLQQRCAAAPGNPLCDSDGVAGTDEHAAQRESALSSLLIVSSIAARRADYDLRDDTPLLTFLSSAAAAALRSVSAQLHDDYAVFSRARLLLGLVEGGAAVRAAGEGEQLQALVRLLVREAFGGKREAFKQAALESLERLVARSPAELLAEVIAPAFQNNASYRSYIIVFLAHFVKNFPYESYAAFSAVADIFMGGLSDNSSAPKEEASIFNVAVGQLLRLSVATLPNVSSQPSQHHLAVGRRDGKVVVYNVKTVSIVTSFQAHQAPVLGVAYSGNIVTLDIATIAEPMNEIKIWRSANQASSIATFFGGSSGTSFKLVSTVEVPATGHTAAGAALLIKHFHLSWLSPQCLEFSSPWHGKIQVALP